MHAFRTFSFTPPKFLTLPACGVVFSDHGLKCVRFVQARGYLKPEFAKIVRIPQGVVEHGSIKNFDVLSQLLAQLKQEVGVDFVHTAVPEEHAYIFNLTLPHIDAPHLRNAIAYQLQDHVPIPPEDLVFDFEIISKPQSGKHVQVAVTAIEKEVALAYMRLFSNAGFTLLSLEVEAHALARALVRDRTESLMIVSLGRTRTGISIVENGFVRYTSTLEIGGDAFTTLIARDRNVSYEEADRIKQEEGLTSHTSDLQTILANVVSAFKDEIHKRRDYWNEHVAEGKGKNKGIRKIVLCGGNATVPGLADHLAFQTGIDVVVGDVWGRAFSLEDVVPPVPHNQSMRFASAIGVAMRRLL